MRRRLFIVAGLALSALAGGCGLPPFDRFSLALEKDPGGLVLLDVRPVRQKQADYCGAACLEMVARWWSVEVNQDQFVERAGGLLPKGGLAIGSLREAALKSGLQAFVFEGDLEKLTAQLDRGRPVIVGVELTPRKSANPVAWAAPSFRHFMVAVGYHARERYLVFADPFQGMLKSGYDRFEPQWQECGKAMLVAAPAKSK